MNDNKLALNESIQIHELLTLKNLILTKSATMLPLVNDPELKEIMQIEVQTGEKHIEDLRDILNKDFQFN